MAGSAIKLPDGGWFPLLLGFLLFTVMATWKRGRNLLMASITRDDVELPVFLGSLKLHDIQRASRVAVYMVANPAAVPQALLHNIKHYQTLHETNLVVTVQFVEVPWLDDQQRILVE